MEIYWLEQDASSVPAGDEWLSGAERARLEELRIPKRRADWRLGRWTAKSALSVYCGLPDHLEALSEIELRPKPSGAPEVFCRDQPVGLAFSLSHSGGRAMCVIVPGSLRVGCDLEAIEERSPAFLADFFTEQEQKLVAETPPIHRGRLVTLLWSAKESALKALGCGLRSDTQWVNALPESFTEPGIGRSDIAHTRWNPLTVTLRGGMIFCGWWSEFRGQVRTVVAEPAAYSLKTPGTAAVPFLLLRRASREFPRAHPLPARGWCFASSSLQ